MYSLKEILIKCAGVFYHLDGPKKPLHGLEEILKSSVLVRTVTGGKFSLSLCL